MTRWAAFGDLHGRYCDREAYSRFVRFCEMYEPQVIVLGGDVFDFTALRRGATEEDKAEGIDEEIALFRGVMARIHPTVYLLGNHEARLIERLNSPNAVMRAWAKDMLDTVHEVARKCGCRVYEYDARRGVFELGPLRFVHGTYYGKHAAAAHAAVYGTVVFFHVHTFSVATVPRYRGKPGGDVAISCPRMCKDIPYMLKRSDTLRQESGWLYGEVTSRGAWAFGVARESEGFVTL